MVRPLLGHGAMSNCLALVLTLTACTSIPPEDPEIVVNALSPPGVWFEGERQQLVVRWPAGTVCTNNGWSCDHGDAPEFRITEVTCDGCRALDVPVGKSFWNASGFDFEAMTTDAITVQVTVESGGDRRRLTATGVGDRELEVRARCFTIFTSLLGNNEIGDYLHPCGASHRPQETVLVNVAIHTLRGTDRFPFCPDDARCSPDWPRKTSTISIDPPPSDWQFDMPVFTDPAGATVAISAPLDTGAISTTSVAVPPLAPAP
jgi:hypothetical protein